MTAKRYTDDLARGYVVRWVHRYPAKSDGAMIARSAWWYGDDRPWNAWGPLDYSVMVFTSRSAAAIAIRRCELARTGVGVQTLAEARATAARQNLAILEQRRRRQ